MSLELNNTGQWNNKQYTESSFLYPNAYYIAARLLLDRNFISHAFAPEKRLHLIYSGKIKTKCIFYASTFTLSTSVKHPPR